MTATKKRLARDFDRAYAADLARRYRSQEPERFEYEGKVYEDVVTGDLLASELERFAVMGTWEGDALQVKNERTGEWEWIKTAALHREWHASVIRDNYHRLRNKGVAQLEALGILATAFGDSEDQIHAILYRKKSRTKRPP